MSEWLGTWDELWRHEAQRFPKDDKIVRARLRHYEKLGPQILAAYTSTPANRAAKVKVGEWKFDIRLEGFPVRGIVDQVREEPDGSLLVIDFKTSKEPLEELILRTEPQLSVYAAAVEAHFGVWPRVAQYHLRSGQLMETTRTPRDVLAVVSMIREGQRRIDNDLLTRQLGHHCGQCPFKNPCLRSI